MTSTFVTLGKDEGKHPCAETQDDGACGKMPM